MFQFFIFFCSWGILSAPLVTLQLNIFNHLNPRNSNAEDHLYMYIMYRPTDRLTDRTRNIVFKIQCCVLVAFAAATVLKAKFQSRPRWQMFNVPARILPRITSCAGLASSL